MIVPKRARPGRALLLPRVAYGYWGSRCPHGTIETWPSQRIARIACRFPADWCALCAAARQETYDRLCRLLPLGLPWSFDHGTDHGSPAWHLRLLDVGTLDAAAIAAIQAGDGSGIGIAARRDDDHAHGFDEHAAVQPPIRLLSTTGEWVSHP